MYFGKEKRTTTRSNLPPNSSPYITRREAASQGGIPESSTLEGEELLEQVYCRRRATTTQNLKLTEVCCDRLTINRNSVWMCSLSSSIIKCRASESQLNYYSEFPVVSHPTRHRFPAFRNVTIDEVSRVIGRCPSSQCSLDPAPTWLIKSLIGTFAPILANMIISSLRTSQFPASHKHAVVKPILKKSSLDTAQLANYTPVSNRSFVFKLLERCVVAQITKYLNDYEKSVQRDTNTTRCLCRRGPSSISVPNVKQIAVFVQKLLGVKNFEIGSRDQGHAHLGVVL